MGLNPGSGRSPGEGNVDPLQCSCLENPMDSRAWRATIMRLEGVRHDLVTTQQQQQLRSVQFFCFFSFVCLFFCMLMSCFSMLFVEKTIFTLLCSFRFFQKDQLTIFMQVHFGAPRCVFLNTVFFSFVCVCMCVFFNLDKSTLFSLKGLGIASPAGSFFLPSSVSWNRIVSILRNSLC